MDEQTKREHAKRLIEWHNDEYEFCLVYEDEQLEDASHEDQRAIHNLMYSARLNIYWDDK